MNVPFIIHKDKCLINGFVILSVENKLKKGDG